jgi:hypothetical protein
MLVAGYKGYTQEAEGMADSLYAAKLMQTNLELYQQADSLNLIIKQCQSSKQACVKQVDSLQNVINHLRNDFITSTTQVDTLGAKLLRTKQELLGVKQQMLALNTELEAKLQLLRDKEFQLNDCQVKLREAQASASLDQAKLAGKLDVNNTRVEAKDHEIDYLKESLKEKDRIISEKTTELSTYYKDKSISLRVIDSLSRALNTSEIQLVKVTERLSIIEAQYNQMIAQQNAATNKKKKIRFVQGVALKSYRTPNWQLAPQSSSTTSVYVITNKNGGKVEFDYITGVSVLLYDLSEPEAKYTYDAGMFIGFGGTNLFKNFYLAPSLKAFDFFHFMMGVNVAEYDQLQSGFNEGDVLPPGMSIPTVKEWKANFFFGMTIDFELLSNITKKM